LGKAESEFGAFYFKSGIWWHLAPVLPIFLLINEHAGQLLVGPNALSPTQPKFWGWAMAEAHAAHPVAPHGRWQRQTGGNTLLSVDGKCVFDLSVSRLSHACSDVNF